MCLKQYTHCSPPLPSPALPRSEREKLLHLADELHKRVVGQEEAVDAVAGALSVVIQFVCGLYLAGR